MIIRNEKTLCLLRNFIPLFFVIIVLIPYDVFAQQSIGISPLIQLPNLSAEKLTTGSIRSLFTSKDLEKFLNDLEGRPPQWESLHDQPGEELGERLFRLNRIRDKTRNGHHLLHQRIAFLWSGFLRQYDSEHQGFRIAMGPVLTKTSWGIVRFKPMNIPNNMIAIPSKNLLGELQLTIEQGKQIEIDILFTGFLVPKESLMYAFSHDDLHLGMILPFVQIDGIQYILR